MNPRAFAVVMGVEALLAVLALLWCFRRIEALTAERAALIHFLDVVAPSWRAAVGRVKR